MKINSIKLAALFAAVFTVFCFCSFSWAEQWIIEDFNAADGTSPVNWTLLNGTADDLRIINDSYQADRVGTAYAISKFHAFDSSNWDDYTIQCDIQKGYWTSSTTTYVGLAARIQSNYENHYFAAMYGGRLKLYRSSYNGSGYGGRTWMASSSQSFTYVPGQWWRMTLTVDGSTISAALYDQSDNLQATVAANDSTYTQGSPGVRSYLGTNAEEFAQWDNFIVPQPATATFYFDSAGYALVNGKRTFVYAACRDTQEDFQMLGEVPAAQINAVHSYHFDNFLPEQQPYSSTQIDQYIADAQSYLSLAQDAGLGVIVAVPREIVQTADVSNLSQIVTQLQSSPALWFWYLFENPSNADNRTISLSTALSSCYNQIKTLDPCHPVIIADNEQFAVYGPYCDIICPNTYSLPASFTSFLNTITEAQNALPGKHLWPMLGVYDLRTEDYPGITLTDQTCRPTPAEIRAQFHAAVAAAGRSGGTALYWQPQSVYDITTDTPQVWNAIGQLGSEIDLLSDALTSTESVGTITINTEFPVRPEEDGQVLHWARKLNGSIYLGIVNASYKPKVRVNLQLPQNFTTVVQYPQGVTVVENTGGQLVVDYDAAGALISPTEIANINNSLVFYLNECDTVVWRFDP